MGGSSSSTSSRSAQKLRSGDHLPASAPSAAAASCSNQSRAPAAAAAATADQSSRCCLHHCQLLLPLLLPPVYPLPPHRCLHRRRKPHHLSCPCQCSSNLRAGRRAGDFIAEVVIYIVVSGTMVYEYRLYVPTSFAPIERRSSTSEPAPNQPLHSVPAVGST